MKKVFLITTALFIASATYYFFKEKLQRSAPHKTNSQTPPLYPSKIKRKLITNISKQKEEQAPQTQMKPTVSNKANLKEMKQKFEFYQYGEDFKKDFFSNKKEYDCCEEISEGSFFDKIIGDEEGPAKVEIKFYLAVDEKRNDLFTLIGGHGLIEKIVTYAPPKVSYNHGARQPIAFNNSRIFLPPLPFSDRLVPLIKKFYEQNPNYMEKLKKQEAPIMNCMNLVLTVYPHKRVRNNTDSEDYIPVGVHCRTSEKKSYKVSYGLLVTRDLLWGVS